MRVTVVLSLLVVWIARNQATADCGLASKLNVTSQAAQLTAVLPDETTDRTLDIFKRALGCRHRLWNTPSTQLGSKPVYFVNKTDLSTCEYNPTDQNCVSVPDSFLNEAENRRAVDELTGYEVISGGQGRTETLVLNASRSDLINRTAQSAKEMLETSKNRYSRCKKLTSDKTIELNLHGHQMPKNEVGAFCMHEDLHLHQREWTKSEPESNAALEIEKKNQSEIIHYWERLSFHLLSHAREASASTSSNRQTSKHLSLAKAYFDAFKTKFPNSLISLSNEHEGTAQYVESRSKILSLYGCNISDSDLNRLVTEDLAKTVGQHALPSPSPYVLSALASQALQVANVPNWQTKVEKDPRTPLELLFAEVPTERIKIPTHSQSHALAMCLAK